MKKRHGIFFTVVAALMVLGMSAAVSLAGEEAPRITKEELKGMMENPDLVILDVRYGKDWDDSKEKIKGALREDPKRKAETWVEKYAKDKTIVLYCA